MTVQEEDLALVESLVGRTITAAVWCDASPDDDWSGHEEATLTLDDGRMVRFSGWGYDAWGAIVELVAPVGRVVE